MGDQYAARHNPFIYFHSIIDQPAYCAQHVVAAVAACQSDLRPPATTPNLVLHHARPVRRRPRRAVRRRPARAAWRRSTRA